MIKHVVSMPFLLQRKHLHFLFQQCLFSNFSNNKITDIEEGAFEGASGVNEILLTSNRLENVQHKMFKGLESLKTL
jgi:hypothetical protein